MNKSNKLIFFIVSISIFWSSVYFMGFATENIVTDNFFVFVKAEYCNKTENIIEDIDNEHITYVRELTNPKDYDEPYTPMLLVVVDKAPDSFEKAQKYFQDKEYLFEIRYNVYVGSENFALSGDVDNDGVITASDARFALRCAVGLEEYTYEMLALMDMNWDNSVTAYDARAILRLSVGLTIWVFRKR